MSIAGDAINAIVTAEKNKLQDQSDLIDQKKAKDIEAANQTITNEQDKAAAIAVIEARAQSQKQALELKQRQLDERKARFAKAQAVAEIVLSTSIAVAKALASAEPPRNIIQAAIVGAIGAARLAVALATPIPKYKHGTEYHRGGAAIVGDGGRSELVTTPTGEVYVTPSRPTLVDLPKGTKVSPDADAALEHGMRKSMRELPALSIASDNGAATVEAITKEGRLTRAAIKNKRETIINGSHGGLVMLHRWGQNWVKYIDEQI
jgi:hypothetical protein